MVHILFDSLQVIAKTIGEHQAQHMIEQLFWRSSPSIDVVKSAELYALVIDHEPTKAGETPVFYRDSKI